MFRQYGTCLFALLLGLGTVGWMASCAKTNPGDQIIIRVLPSSFVNAGSKVTLSIQVRTSDGKSAADGSTVNVSTTPRKLCGKASGA